MRSRAHIIASIVALGGALHGCADTTTIRDDAHAGLDAGHVASDDVGNRADALGVDASGGGGCELDCAMVMGRCGDMVCDPATLEDARTCPTDCAPISMCGDGVCGAGENAAFCPEDCSISTGCGDGVCDGSEDPVTCPRDCASSLCGDGLCGRSESPESCPEDCLGACGDGRCSPGEDPRNCPFDCGIEGSCGDGACGIGESPRTCPLDCARCGDGVCSPPLESLRTCPIDCGGA
jgi:hypothetical protein